MPEIRHDFTGGKMNKDVDERLLRNGEYRHAVNVQVRTTDSGSDGDGVGNAGTVQNIKGNTEVASIPTYTWINNSSAIADKHTCVASIADEKSDKAYWFFASNINEPNFYTEVSSADSGEVTYSFNSNVLAGWSPIIYKDFILETRADGTQKMVVSDLFRIIDIASNIIEDMSGDQSSFLTTAGWSEILVSQTYSGVIRPGMEMYVLTNDGPLFSKPPVVKAVNGGKVMFNEELYADIVGKAVIIIFSAPRVLNFSKYEGSTIYRDYITGINIIDNLLFWTDGNSEPKKINIDRCIAGTPQNYSTNSLHHTKVFIENSDGIFVDANTLENELDNGGTSLGSGVDSYLKEEHLTVLRPAPKAPPSLDMSRTTRPGSNNLEFTYQFVDTTTNVLLDQNESFTITHDSFTNSAFRPNDLLVLSSDTPDYVEFEATFISYIDANGDTTLTATSTIEIKTNQGNEEIQPTNLNWVLDLVQPKPLFELNLVRFAYRYQYEDGEYSGISPWSEVAFMPKPFGYTAKTAHNVGMENDLRELKIRDFLPYKKPLDVKKVDILYKSTSSPNIYIVESIKRNKSAEWLYFTPNGSSDNVIKRGELNITSEMVHRVLSQDQVLRGWDNVPRYALAQEITGNRLVYGNYIQGYDIKENVNLIQTVSSLDSPSITNPMKSLKSMRDYKIGMVFGDKYGRETPVIESGYSMSVDQSAGDYVVTTGDINIPKQLSIKQNSFSVRQSWGDATSEVTPPTLNNDGWIDYVKYYVKETSSEYYNIVMDRWYPSGDLGTIWLSFNSADRNKVDEDTHLILKNRNGSDDAVLNEARYKIIAIENEAPEYIKTAYSNLGSIEISDTNTTEDGSSSTDSVIWSGTPQNSSPSGFWSSNRYIRIKKTSWASAGMGNDDSQMVFGKQLRGRVDFRLKACSGSNCKTTPWIKVASAHRSSDVIQISWTGYLSEDAFDLYGLFNDLSDSGFPEYAVASMVYNMEFRESVVENKPEFDGKFFVKINTSLSTNEDIQNLGGTDFEEDAVFRLRYISSTSNSQATNQEVTGISSDIDVYSGNTTSPEWFLDAFDGVTATNDLDFEFDNASAMLLSSNGVYSMADSYLVGTTDEALPPHVEGEGGYSPFGSCSNNYNDMTIDFWKSFHNWNSADLFGWTSYNNQKEVWIDNCNTTWIRYYAGDHWNTGLNPNLPEQIWDASQGYGPNGEGEGLEKCLQQKPGQFTGADGEYGSPFYAGVGNNGDGSYGAQSNTVGSMALSHNAGSFDEGTVHDEPELITALKEPGRYFKFTADPDGIIYKTLGVLYRAEGANFTKRNANDNIPTQTSIVNAGYTNTGPVQCSDGTWATGFECDDGTTYDSCGYGWGWQPPCPSTVYQYANNCGTHSTSHPLCKRKTYWIEFRRIIPETGATLNVGLDLSQFDPRNLLHHDGRNRTGITILRVSQIEQTDEVQKETIGAVFETEPKESVDLDVYYEATSSIPMSLSPKNAFDFAPIDSKVTVYRNMQNIDLLDENDDFNLIQAPLSWGKFMKNHRVGNIHFTNVNESTNSDVLDKDVIIQVIADDAPPVGFEASADPIPLLVKELIKVGDKMRFTHPNGTTTSSVVTGVYEPINPTASFNSLDQDDIDHGVNSGPKAFKKAEGILLDCYFNSDTGYIQALESDVPDEIYEGDYYITTAFFYSEILSVLTGVNLTIPYQVPNGPAPVIPQEGASWNNVSNDDGLMETQIPFEGDADPNLAEEAPAVTPLWMEVNNVPTDKPIVLYLVKYTGYYSIDKDVWKYDVGLPWFNCYTYGNGVESDRIRDDFNAPQLDNGVKVSTTFSGYGEEKIGSGLIYSGIYNSTSQVNDLNEFNMSEKITKSLNPTYGSIQRLKTRDTDIIAFTEDKVLKILSNKDAVFNADGNPQLTATDKVLGQVVPFVGDYGISNNPESLAWDQYRMYFTDRQRGAVLRLSRDGITPISNVGMKTWFRDNLKLTDRLLGTFDVISGEYNLSLRYYSELYMSNTTVSFNEASKGWVSFKEFVPDSGLSMSGSYYTSKYEKVYKHHVVQEADGNSVVPRNSWYDLGSKQSSITLILNDQADQVKSFKTVSYEGSQARINKFVGDTQNSPNGGIQFDGAGMPISPTYSAFNANDNEYYNLVDKDGWFVSNLNTDLQEGKIHEFKEKEGKWFNKIQGIESSLVNLDTSEFTVQGIGMVSDVIYTGTIYTGGPEDCYDTDGNVVNCNSDDCVEGPCGEVYIEVLGCTDDTASNYNSNANTDDGSCEYFVVGCTDPLAPNWLVGANVNAAAGTEGACEDYVFGCMDPEALNYNADATVSGTCYDVNYLAIDCLVEGGFGLIPNPDISFFNLDMQLVPTAACTYCLDENGDGECDEIVECPDGYEIQGEDCVPIPEEDIIGCMNQCLYGYNPLATISDETMCGDCIPNYCENCNGDQVIGCMDDGGVEAGGTYASPAYPGYAACTYDPNANLMDWSLCTYNCYVGCTDYLAGNFNPNAIWDDGSCEYGGEIPIVGCMLEAYYEYNPNATVNCMDGDVDEFLGEPIIPDVGSCCTNLIVEPCNEGDGCEEIGCMDQEAENYDENATLPCGGEYTMNPTGCCYYETDILGCTDITAFNYDPEATFDDGSCVPVIEGCTDATMQNYQENANTLCDGCCIPHIYGCTDVDSFNFDSGATLDDGSCVPYLFGCTDPDATNFGQGYIYDINNNLITEDSLYWDADTYPAQAEYNIIGNVYYDCEYPLHKMRIGNYPGDSEAEESYDEIYFDNDFADDDGDGIPNVYDDN